MSSSKAQSPSANADAGELLKFSELASRWWDPTSEFRPLHEINPLRLDWIDGLHPCRANAFLMLAAVGAFLLKPWLGRARRLKASTLLKSHWG
jgi:2-polyprenyl-6-hydroxyphenyl methylase / 3-demethylubiquinone-9 3-methyltransferase